MSAKTLSDFGRILEATYTSTDVIPGQYDLKLNHWARGTVLYVYSTQAGSLNVYYVDLKGVQRLLLQQAILANDLKWVDFEIPVPRLAVDFTPAAAPGTESLSVDAYSIGWGP